MKSFELKNKKLFGKKFSYVVFVYYQTLFFSLTQKISAFTFVLRNMKSFIFDFKLFLFYCFHYLNRSYGRFVLLYVTYDVRRSRLGPLS